MIRPTEGKYSQRVVILTGGVLKTEDLGVGQAHGEGERVCELTGRHVPPDKDTVGLALVTSSKFKHYRLQN